MKRLIYAVALIFGLMLSCWAASAQDNGAVLSGTVVDSKTSEPLIGASVLIKGTTTGSITDLDGNFSIKVEDGMDLVISCIGYEDCTYVVGQQRQGVIIKMKESAEFLEEVVVVGYGTVKKENLSGAVDQVSSETFENRPVANTTQMLQGAVPNLNISLADGKPNSSASYNVRGKTSIGAGGSALILIDGVEGDPAMLNPNDIESVSVLKDAASAAIYGSRAPYGVVLITTKSAKEDAGKFQLTYTGNISVQQPTNMPNIVDDGYVYADMFYKAWYGNRFSEPTAFNKSQEFSSTWLKTFRQRNKAGNPVATTVQPDGKYVYYGNENYYDLLYKDNVLAQTHNVSINGKSGKTKYYVSGRYYSYEGLYNYNPDTYDTFNLRAKAEAEILPWLTFTENVEYTYDDYHYPFGSAKEGSGVLGRSISDEGHPSSPAFNPDGTLTTAGAMSIGGLVTGNNWLDRITKTFKTTSALKASLLKNKLTLNGDFTFRGKDYTETKKQTAVPYSTYEGEIIYLGTPEIDDKIKESVRTYNYMALNAYAQYEDKFAQKHSVKVLAGYNYEQQTYKSVYVERDGLITPDVNHINHAIGETITTSSGGEKWRYAGAFFRLNYGYDDRYLLEINGRYDGSSKFPNNAQWGFFPSVSAAWRISQEPWWKVSPDAITNLKLRASYGELGNSNVSPYAYLEKFEFSNSGRYLNGLAKRRKTSAPSMIPDNIGWERSQTLDVGVDAEFFRGRLSFTADYYIRKTLDMYTVGPTLPDTFGASSPKGNYADMSTYGYELTIGWNDFFDVAGKPFNYGVKATLADYYTIIDRYNNDSKKLSDYYEGQRLGEIWGFVCNGLFQSQDEIDAAFDGTGYKNTLYTTTQSGITLPGDPKFEDLDHNHTISKGAETVDDPGDLTIIGNSEPRYVYSFNLNASWNGISLSAFFQGVGKQDWYPGKECAWWGQYNRPYNNVYIWQLDNYWTEENPEAYLPRYAGYNDVVRSGTNSRYLQDVSYIRLKNLQIGYSLPQNIIKKAHLSNVNIYFSAENLWTWSPMYKYSKDFDVLTITKKSDDYVKNDRGTGYNYPTMRTFSFGVTITY